MHDRRSIIVLPYVFFEPEEGVDEGVEGVVEPVGGRYLFLDEVVAPVVQIVVLVVDGFHFLHAGDVLLLLCAGGCVSGAVPLVLSSSFSRGERRMGCERRGNLQ